MVTVTYQNSERVHSYYFSPIIIDMDSPWLPEGLFVDYKPRDSNIGNQLFNVAGAGIENHDPKLSSIPMVKMIFFTFYRQVDGSISPILSHSDESKID